MYPLLTCPQRQYLKKLYYSITTKQWHWQGQNTHLLHYRVLYVPTWTHVSHSQLPTPPFLKLWKSPLCFIIFISTMLYKWNNPVCILWGLGFFPPILFLQNFIRWHESIFCPFQWLSSIPWHELTKVHSNVYLLRGIWAIPQSCYIWLCTDPCGNINFYFSGINARNIIGRFYVTCMLRCFGNCFLEWPHFNTFSSAVGKWLSFSVSLPAFDVVRFF